MVCLELYLYGMSEPMILKDFYGKLIVKSRILKSGIAVSKYN